MLSADKSSQLKAYLVDQPIGGTSASPKPPRAEANDSFYAMNMAAAIAAVFLK